MNGESFYDSFQDWQPPSPRSTPQSTKFGFYPLQSPIAPGSSPIPPQHGWMTSPHSSSTPSGQNQPFPGEEAVGRSSKTKKSKRQRPPSVAYSPGGQQSTSMQPLNPNYHQASFPSGSFVERFDSTTLDDPFTGPPGMVASTTTAQMQTPPPTRDDSAKKKPHQPRLVEFQTPSTIISRRMSVPNDMWHQQTSDFPFQDPSPFSFTPLQFSPPPPHFGFAHSGPMTAPAYPQSGLFWDPNSNHNLNQMSFSTIAEESFGMNSHSVGHSFTLDGPHPTHRFATSESFGIPNQLSSSMPRPQSARPADPRHGGSSSKSSFVSGTSSVDPTVLWNTQNADTASFSRPPSVVASATLDSRQPYQHQTESLRREKEERSRRGLQASSGSTSSDLAPNSAERSLRRSLTDSRARRSGVKSQAIQGTTSNPPNATYASMSAQIPREASPLKRHKSGSQRDQLTPTKPPPRRSVVLTVDAKGRARTEVKPFADDSSLRTIHRAPRSLDEESDSSDLPGPIRRNPNSQLSGGIGSSPPSSDAQEALREVVRSRKMKRPDTAQYDPRPSSAHSGYPLIPSSASKSNQTLDSSQSNNSPTTITDPDFHTPTRDGNLESSGNTRCVCNGKVPEDRANLMIECESCKNWLHVACLGISPEQIPPVFVCLFCSSSPAATRAGRQKNYSGTMYHNMGGQESHEFM